MLEDIPKKFPPIATRIAAEEALRNNLEVLTETIGRIVLIAKSMPAGERRNSLFDEISNLDVVAETAKIALDSLI
jgi:hypothetical protein